ncbi:RNA recognition motif domain-containing protein [Beggiatoa alba]|nr:RNA-binding protein [Beggiatoa alba]
MNLIISNLPPSITQSEVEHAFRQRGADVQVSLFREGNPNNVLAVVKLKNASLVATHRMAQYLKGRSWQGRRLQVYVPLFWRGESEA